VTGNEKATGRKKLQVLTFAASEMSS
jgi:hypothetical protein